MRAMIRTSSSAGPPPTRCLKLCPNRHLARESRCRLVLIFSRSLNRARYIVAARDGRTQNLDGRDAEVLPAVISESGLSPTTNTSSGRGWYCERILLKIASSRFGTPTNDGTVTNLRILTFDRRSRCSMIQAMFPLNRTKELALVSLAFFLTFTAGAQLITGV